MSSKHVVLRSIPRPRGGPERTPMAGPATAAPSIGPAVEREDIDSRRATHLERSPEVLAVAPVIRMKLVQPLDVDVPVTPSASGVAWGVEAVGATASPFDGDGITVSVLDTGIDKTHPAFAGVEL